MKYTEYQKLGSVPGILGSVPMPDGLIELVIRRQALVGRQAMLPRHCSWWTPVVQHTIWLTHRLQLAKIAKKQNKAKTTPQRLLVIHNLPTTKTPRGSSCYLPHKTPRAVS